LHSNSQLSKSKKCPGGEIGRHASFRCWSSQGGGGSSPLLGTISKDDNPYKLLILKDFMISPTGNFIVPCIICV
jgi:hypothetical protein